MSGDLNEPTGISPCFLETEKTEGNQNLTGNTTSPYFVPIYPVVTRDMARLIRLPGSLYVRGNHTGMCRVLEIPRVEKIDNYHLQIAPSEYNRVCTVPLLSY